MKSLVALIGIMTLMSAVQAASFKLEATGSEPLYQTTLTKEVYQFSRRDHLKDLAIINADGESIPYALMSYATLYPQTKVTAESKPLVIFPMQESTLNQNKVMNIQLNSHDSNTSVNVTSGAANATAKTYYLFDLGQQHPGFKKLTLDWQGREGKLVTVDVKTSDNFKDWVHAGQAALLKVTAGEQAIVENSVTFDHLIEARYLQILPQETTDAFALTAVNVEYSYTQEIAQPILWQEIPYTQREQTNTALTHIDFESAGRYPASHLKVNLPQKNSITQVTILSRNRNEDAWHYVTKASLYRFNQHNKDYVNQDISIPTTTARYWRLTFDQASGGIGKDNPVFSLGWLPDILVWNARGSSPYSMRIGDVSNAVNVVAVSSLVQPYKLEKVLQLPSAGFSVLEHEQSINAWDTPADYKPLWLWGGLFLGVLALAVMAYSLIKNNPKA
jgi:hypothetical protein